MNDIKITLPDKIYFLQTIPDSISNSMNEEFSIYYENIIYPYSDVFDVEVISDYGANHKRFWRISNYEKDDSFDVIFKVYAPYGKLVAEKTVTMIPIKKHFSGKFDILCIGDSMTRSVTYMEHIQNKLYRVNFKGTRSFNGILYHEGRGGWTLGKYLTSVGDDPSPFLFPVGVDNYYANMDFYNLTTHPSDNIYCFSGYYDYPKIQKGEVYCSKGCLYTYDGEKLSDNPEWEFNFSKYIKRHNIGHLDAVSFLFGANDMQISKYEETDAHVSQYIKNMNIMISSIREYDPDMKIIINMPIPGADQNAWGFKMCLGSEKRYNYNMMKLSEAIIENYSSDKNIFISPMAACIDRMYGFSSASRNANQYCEEKETFQSNWVHPNKTGYAQMGDALAAVIEKIRG